MRMENDTAKYRMYLGGKLQASTLTRHEGSFRESDQEPVYYLGQKYISVGFGSYLVTQ